MQQNGVERFLLPMQTIKMIQNCNITFPFGNKPEQLLMIDNRAIVKPVQRRKMQKCTALSRD